MPRKAPTPVRRKKLPAASSSILVRHARNVAELMDDAPRDPNSDFLKKGRAKFTQAQAFGAKQQKRENEDRKFFAGEQWDESVKSQRAGQEANNGLPPIPARPCLTVNLQREKVQQVVNGMINADLGYELVPADDFGSISDPPDANEIELREGLARRIQRNSDAEKARLWAAKNAVIAGQGTWGVNVRYVPGKTRDQEIFIERYWDQNAVLWGPHTEPDASDAEDLFIGKPMPWDDYREKYPRSAAERKARGDDGDGDSAESAPTLTDGEFDDFHKLYPDWFTVSDKGAKFVLVVRWYFYERQSRELAMFDMAPAMWVDELPANTPKETYTVRRVVERTVGYADIDGARVLERGQWAGPDIPGVKIVADEIPPYDGEYRAEGQVRPSIDSQKGFNFMLSRGVEMVAVTPVPPLQLDPEAIQGFEQWYWFAPTRVFPYLPYRTRDDSGREFRPPQRPNVEPNIQPVAAFFQVFRDAIQSTSGVHEPSVGKVDPRLKSGRAIVATIRQDEHGTSHYVDNYARSIQREATIVNNLLYPIYGRPGRMAKIINGQGEPQNILIGQPFVMQQGRPVQAPQGAQDARTYRLTPDARFEVAMKVTKNYDLKRTQLAEFLGGIIESNPEMMSIFGDKFFDALDVPDRRELAERAKAILAPPIQQLLAQKKAGIDVPPMIQQQLAEGAKMIQGLTQTVEQQQRQLETDAIKAQQQMTLEQLKIANDRELKQLEFQQKIELAHIESAKAIEIARINAEAKGAIESAKLKAHEEEIATGIAADAAAQATTDAHAQMEADAQRTHERAMQRDTQSHDASLASADRGAESDEAERGRQHDRSMGAMQHASAMAQTKEKAKGKPNGAGA